MFKKIFDRNQPVRHASYGAARRKFERDMRRTDLFFKILTYGTLIAFMVFALFSLMAR